MLKDLKFNVFASFITPPPCNNIVLVIENVM